MVQTLRTKAFVFDLDGTLIDTTALVEQFWRDFALENDLDAEKILASSHGRTTLATLSRWTPHKATQEVVDEYERKIADKKEGVDVLPGVTALLDKIPLGKMAIYTAATHLMATKRLQQCNITIPNVLETASSVSKGKPDPEGYLACARRLGIDPKDCLVFEDAPSGVQAARAAGMTVIACLTTHSRERLNEAGAHFLVNLLSDVDVCTLPDGSFQVTLSKIQ